MHLYQAGVPLPTISEWLGHSNIETTRFYVKVTEEMKRETLRKLSDSDNFVFKDDVHAWHCVRHGILPYNKSQLEEFTSSFVQRLPKYMQQALCSV